MKTSSFICALFAATAFGSRAVETPFDNVELELAGLEPRGEDLPITRHREESNVLEARAPTKCRAHYQGPMMKRDEFSLDDEFVEEPQLATRTIEPEEEEELEARSEDDLDGTLDWTMSELADRDLAELDARRNPMCKVKGVLRHPSRPVKVTGITRQQCANRCLCPSSLCRSFSFVLKDPVHKTGICGLYSKNLPQMGFHPDPKGHAIFWGRRCYRAAHPTPTGPVHTNGPRALNADESSVERRGTLAGLVVDALTGFL